MRDFLYLILECHTDRASASGAYLMRCLARPFGESCLRSRLRGGRRGEKLSFRKTSAPFSRCHTDRAISEWSVSKIKKANQNRPAYNYLISCSNSANSSEWKNSSIVIPNPSQSFLIVDIVALLFLPLTMLFTVDCVTPLMPLSLLIEILRSWHN